MRYDEATGMFIPTHLRETMSVQVDMYVYRDRYERVHWAFIEFDRYSEFVAEYPLTSRRLQ